MCKYDSISHWRNSYVQIWLTDEQHLPEHRASAELWWQDILASCACTLKDDYFLAYLNHWRGSQGQTHPVHKFLKMWWHILARVLTCSLLEFSSLWLNSNRSEGGIHRLEVCAISNISHYFPIKTVAKSYQRNWWIINCIYFLFTPRKAKKIKDWIESQAVKIKMPFSHTIL